MEQGTPENKEVVLRVATPETHRRPWYKNYKYIVPLALLAVIATLIVVWILLPTPVTVIRATERPVTRTITSTGQVTGARETPVGVDIASVVAAIYTREGDQVTEGQLLFSLRTTELDAQVNQARQAVRTAQAQLNQVLAGPSQAEIERARSELARAQSVGLAIVRAAEARLRDLQAGATTEEIAQAEANVRRLRAAEEQARTDLRRTELLVQRGAVSQAELDRARTALQTAIENRRAAEQQLARLRAGTRPEQIAQARADLASARASYRTSVQAAQATLNTLLEQPRPADVQVARERVSDAQAALNAALEQRSKANVYAPYNGIITQLNIERGQPITPGQTAMRIVELGRPEITVDLEENDLGDVKVGQEAIITSQAYRNERLEATVTEIAPRVNPERGTIEVTLVPNSRPQWLRSDLTVDVSIIVATGEDAVFIPVDAVKRVGGVEYAMVVVNGRAEQRRIVTGGAGTEGVVVLSGVKEGDLVIRNADRIMDKCYVLN